jgi:hypothetical protein
MKAVKGAPSDPDADPVVGDPDRDELAPAHHAMLPRGDPREPRIGMCAEKLGLRPSFLLHTPRVAGWVLREGDECCG